MYSTQFTICVYTVYLCTQLSMYLEYAVCAQYYKLQYEYGRIRRLDLHVRSKFRSRSTKFSRSLEIRNTKFSTRVQYSSTVLNLVSATILDKNTFSREKSI